MNSYEMANSAEVHIKRFLELQDTIKQLVNQGFQPISIRIGKQVSINVKANNATKNIASAYKGQGVEGNSRYVVYAGIFNGFQVEWRKQPRAWRAR